MRQLPEDVLADLDVLEDRVGELLVGRVPVRLPIVDDADAHPTRMDLLPHYSLASSGGFAFRREAFGFSAGGCTEAFGFRAVLSAGCVAAAASACGSRRRLGASVSVGTSR